MFQGCDGSFTGALCQSCEDNTFLDSLLQECVPCEASGAGRWLLRLLLLLFVLGILAVAARVNRQNVAGYLNIGGGDDTIDGVDGDQPDASATMRWFGQTLCVRLVLRAAVQPLRIGPRP